MGCIAFFCIRGAPFQVEQGFFWLIVVVPYKAAIVVRARMIRIVFKNITYCLESVPVQTVVVKLDHGFQHRVVRDISMLCIDDKSKGVPCREFSGLRSNYCRFFSVYCGLLRSRRTFRCGGNSFGDSLHWSSNWGRRPLAPYEAKCFPNFVFSSDFF